MTSELSPSPSPLLDRPVGVIVAEDYGRAAVLRRHGIDFCCGGGLPLAEACARKGADPDTVLTELAVHDARAAGAADEAPTDPRALVDHIERVHHAWVRENLPPLLHFTGRVARVHGAGHPELGRIASVTLELAAELEGHMADEERTLFPGIRDGQPEGAGIPAGMLAGLEDDHAHAASLLAELRSLSSDFTPPEGACATWRAAYAKLSEFEADLERHVHLENNVLFPSVRAGA
jgi:regulator of cell morphogenesis and NO signaling